ncbi:hypothetical protein D0Z07_7561 [Hyphodiscus hymeniophilus]|uniref:Uncharacterized protein n=1 Tax=Hyphodiscus hymeniophilus TaxID=353542 RepID=A0A9P6VEU7_9HELO|nr:hypothetical protein D0Z07_7561 [Hyphodiscus hymeniophilus]
MALNRSVDAAIKAFMAEANPPNPHDTSMCLSHALFLHNLPTGGFILWPMLFAIASAISTQLIRSVTPGVGDKPATVKTTITATAAGDEDGTAIPDPAVSAIDVEAGQGGDDPPPYAPPESTSTPIIFPVPATLVRPTASSAHFFVTGTFFFILMLLSLFLLALSLQWLSFCQHYSPTSTSGQVFTWVFFCIPATWATFGLTCWVILLRDLWGPAAKKRFPIEEYALVKGLVMAVAFAALFPFVLSGMLLTKAVEVAQKRLCPGAIAEEDDVEIEELSREDEEPHEVQGEGESSDGNADIHEETVGLIKGMEA